MERSASEIIYNAAWNYKINPKVIITTLQKEQSLITTSQGKQTDAQLKKAMGYEDSRYYGFAKQVNAGTWQFDKYYKDIETNGTTISCWGVGISKATQDCLTITPKVINSYTVQKNLSKSMQNA